MQCACYIIEEHKHVKFYTRHFKKNRRKHYFQGKRGSAYKGIHRNSDTVQQTDFKEGWLTIVFLTYGWQMRYNRELVVSYGSLLVNKHSTNSVRPAQ